ncbi:MAG: glutamyl-tRNA reductase [Solirubrobacteraceae bacterium]|nr:glutamyl-tRNA reductase [Solirubrobacteraceae bacterium]
MRRVGAPRHICHVDLVAISVSHRTAPLHLRERLAMTADGATQLMGALVAAHGVEEAVALCTCHRTELYVATLDPAAARRAVLGALAELGGAEESELLGHVHVLRGAQVSRHLFAVTAGLESMVLGEAEIQGQVRRSLERARAAGTAGPVTGRLFGDALSSGGRVRSRTALGRGGASVSSVAVELARDAAGSLGGRRVLVVGAGQSGALSARALADEGMEVVVASRHRSRAADVADTLGSAASLAEVPAELERADVIFTATAATRRLIGREAVATAMAARGGRPLVIVDLGMPRDVDPSAGELPGVTLLDLDDVDRRLDANHEERRAQSAEAEAIVEHEQRRFQTWLAGHGAAPAVAMLHEQAEAIVTLVLSENDSRWEDLTPADRERVAVVARTIARRLLHEPTRRLRADGEAAADAALELFGLAPERVEAPTAELGRLG